MLTLNNIVPQVIYRVQFPTIAPSQTNHYGLHYDLPEALSRPILPLC
jgi:hypothetical protein